MIPIVVVSGKRDEADRVMALELGADDYIRNHSVRASSLPAFVRYSALSDCARGAPSHGEKARAYRFHGWELNIGTRG